MVISSDFETRSYRSLFSRFGWQFLFFIICLLTSAGILYGIERNSDILSRDMSFDVDYWRKKNIENVEKFINGTGFEAIQEFAQTHSVDSETVKDFIYQLSKLSYTDHNVSITNYYHNLNHVGMKYLEAFVCILSVLTTVGKYLF